MINKIVSELGASVINFNELLFQGNRKLEINGYRCFNMNRKNSKGGGIGTCFTKIIAGNVLKIKEGSKAEIELKDEAVLEAGNMNKHVRNIIPGNHDKVSPGGMLVRELLDTGK